MRSTWSTPALRAARVPFRSSTLKTTPSPPRFPLHRQPVSIEIDPEGRLAYIANSGSNSISVVDLKSRREIAQVGAGEEPVAARLSPDGKTLAVANRKGNSLSLIDPAACGVRAVFAGCPGASDLAILPDSSKAFVACSAGHQVMAVALARASQPANPQSGRSSHSALTRSP